MNKDEYRLKDELGGFQPSSWQQPVQDLVKEYNQFEANQEPEIQDKPDTISLKAAQEGRLNAKTGAYYGLGSKARKIVSWRPSGAFLKNYDHIRWSCQP
jgi:hypothetical protein